MQFIGSWYDPTIPSLLLVNSFGRFFKGGVLSAADHLDIIRTNTLYTRMALSAVLTASKTIRSGCGANACSGGTNQQCT